MSRKHPVGPGAIYESYFRALNALPGPVNRVMTGASVNYLTLRKMHDLGLLKMKLEGKERGRAGAQPIEITRKGQEYIRVFKNLLKLLEL